MVPRPSLRADAAELRGTRRTPGIARPDSAVRAQSAVLPLPRTQFAADTRAGRIGSASERGGGPTGSTQRRRPRDRGAAAHLDDRPRRPRGTTERARRCGPRGATTQRTLARRRAPRLGRRTNEPLDGSAPTNQDLPRAQLRASLRRRGAVSHQRERSAHAGGPIQSNLSASPTGSTTQESVRPPAAARQAVQCNLRCWRTSRGPAARRGIRNAVSLPRSRASGVGRVVSPLGAAFRPARRHPRSRPSEVPRLQRHARRLGRSRRSAGPPVITRGRHAFLPRQDRRGRRAPIVGPAVGRGVEQAGCRRRRTS